METKGHAGRVARVLLSLAILIQGGSKTPNELFIWIDDGIACIHRLWKLIVINSRGLYFCSGYVYSICPSSISRYC